MSPDGEDSLSLIARRIPAGSVVLDVGAGSGALGAYLSARGCTIDGIDVDASQAALTRHHFRRFVEADMEASPPSALLGGETYDVIVFADVLEHLRDPGRIVDDLLPRLRSGGRVMISVPNVSYAGLVAAMMDGEFPYRPTGILDATHLRFFTRKSLLDFLRQRGLGALSLGVVRCPVQHSEFSAHDPHGFPPAVRDALLAPADALTYQFVVEAAIGVETPPELAAPKPGASAPGARLYWAGNGEPFEQARSVGDVGLSSRELRFELPRREVGPARLRLDPVDHPGLLRVESVRMVAPDGAELWRWAGDAVSLEGLPSQQLAEVSIAGRRWWLATGDDPSVELPIPGAVLATGRGAALVAEVEWSGPKGLLDAQSSLAAAVVAQRERAAMLMGDVSARLAALEERAARGERTARDHDARLADERRARQELRGSVREMAARVDALGASLRGALQTVQELSARGEELSARIDAATPRAALRRLAREVRRSVLVYQCELVPEGNSAAPLPDRTVRLTPRTGRLPAGWVAVHFELGAGLPGARLAARDGQGQLHYVQLPHVDHGRSAGVVKLPDQVLELFLDLSVPPRSGRVGRLHARELSLTEAAARLAGPVAWKLRDPRRLAGAARQATQLQRTQGFAGLLRRVREEVLPTTEARTRSYDAWVAEHDTLGPEAVDEIRSRAQSLAEKIGFTVILLLSDKDDEADVEECLRALDAQLFPRWRGLLAGPATLRRSRATRLRIASEPRWTWPPAVTTADILGAVGEDLVAFVRPGDVLAPHALYVLADGFARCLDADVVYADEDALDGGRRVAPWFKPDWSPYRLWGHDYVEHRFACRADLLRRIRLPDRLDDAFAFEVLLGAVELGASARHEPFVLYHVARPHRRDLRAARAALQRHLARRAPGSSVGPGRLREAFHVRLPVGEEPPLVSIIIPTRDRVALLRRCVDTLRENTRYPRYEVLVVDNDSAEPETRRYLEELEARGQARVVRYAGDFNFAAINNLAARQARGTILALLNNDIEIHDPAWLSEMVGWALRDDVGAVGCRLRYADGRVQHAGIVLGVQGLAAHVYRQAEERNHEYARSTLVAREVGAVTAACLVMRRELYEHVGGMDEGLRVAFNDVDLCLRLRAAGRTLLYTPFADLLHLESASRGEDATREQLARTAMEADHLRSKHGSFALHDPFYSPNLSLEDLAASPAFPPRVRRPWLVQRVERPRVAFLAYRLMKGYGVDVVVAEQMEYLCARGHDVTALVLEKDDHYDRRLALYVDTGRLRIVRVRSPEEAAAKLAALQCEVAIAHTPPFHEVLSSVPASVFRVLFDHGEPPPELFPETDVRRGIALAKRAAARAAELSIAISDFVRTDSGLIGARVCRNGNDHMLRRRSNLSRLVGTFRAEHRLGNAFVVLNVTRYLAEERRYKGVEEYAAVRDALLRARPDLAGRVRFVIAGRSEPADQEWAQCRGLDAVSNLDDDQLLGAYLDADLYLSMSQWEGYNLGVGQALALGVPTLASARGAHPEFPIRTSNDPEEVAAWIGEEMTRRTTVADEPRRAALGRLRQASVYPWKSAAADLEALLREGMERHGRPTSGWPASRTMPRHDATSPEVSFIILNKDRSDLLIPCVRSIEEQCDVPYEILIGDTGSTDAETLRFYEETPHAVHYLGFYNFSACNNVLAARARGRHLLFLNNDTQLIETRLREATDYLATHDDVGCLGAYLAYADGRLQHAGVRICAEEPYRGVPEHFDRLKPLAGYPGLQSPRDVVAVTGAMLLIPTERFRGLGGFDEVYQEEAQDIDLCLRLRERGFRSVMHPALQAFHYENSTRTVREAPADRAEFLRRFGRVIEDELFAWQAEAGLV